MRAAPEFPWLLVLRLQLDDVMTTIEIDTPTGPIDALLGLPPGAGPWPGVVVIHDAFGYVPDNEAISERIAQAGFVALTPNMYARRPGPLRRQSHARAADKARPRS